MAVLLCSRCLALGSILYFSNKQIDNVYKMWFRYPTCVHGYVFVYLFIYGGGRVVHILSVHVYIRMDSYGWHISCVKYIHIYTRSVTTKLGANKQRGGGASARALLGGRPRQAVLAQWPRAARKCKAERTHNSALAICVWVYVSKH